MRFSFKKLKIHSFLLSNIVALFLFGCSSSQDNIIRTLVWENPIPLIPFPLLSFAPEVPLLPDTQNTLSGAPKNRLAMCAWIGVTGDWNGCL